MRCETATHTAWSLEVAWGTTVAANDLAVQDIPITALGLVLDVVCPDREMELELSEPGARLDDSGRVMYLDWEDIHRVFMAPPTRRSNTNPA